MGMTNRLAGQSSPYLLQHANNPVDWFPWGEEAFEKARREDKPLLISIGYSTCHWCHVMERECFENPAIAAVMNTHVVAVKVDREERPDVDRIYMTAVQAMTGQGGWPLNVFVTPEGKPFTGGTYFPPETRHGRRGWPEVVEAIGKAWKNISSRERLIAQGEGLTQATREFLVSAPGAPVHRPESVENCFQALQHSFDPNGGGFSRAPKFPLPVNVFFLFRYAAARGGEEGTLANDMALETLRGMARGGIFDHVGGGFHRYSTDDRWFLPHFEKMLYDNAQLAVNFLDAYQVTRSPDFAEVATKTLDYLERDLCHPEGGFFSAEDADSLPPSGETKEKSEGAFYVWSVEEVRGIVGNDAPLLALRYGLADHGNVENDPQGEFPGKNVLSEVLPLEEVADRQNLSLEEASRRLAEARDKLFAVRRLRPRPHLDDKILTSWNGLALSAFARAFSVLGEKRYLTAAQRAAGFLRSHLWDGERLFRRWREGRRDIPALADDHAFLAQGLIDLYGADFDPAHLFWAEQLTDQMLKRFLDPAGGLFSTPSDHDPLLIVRAKEEGDNVEPSASSVAVFNLLRLARFLGRDDFRHAAERMMGAHLGSAGGPQAFPVLNASSLLADAPPRELVIVGDPQDPLTRELLEVVRGVFLPELTVIVGEGPDHPLVQRLPFLKDMRQRGGKPTAYYCHNFACQSPVTMAEELRLLLVPPR
jgi:uncharacterized protein YyaL (SSP411 family)